MCIISNTDVCMHTTDHRENSIHRNHGMHKSKRQREREKHALPKWWRHALQQKLSDFMKGQQQQIRDKQKKSHHHQARQINHMLHGKIWQPTTFRKEHNKKLSYHLENRASALCSCLTLVSDGLPYPVSRQRRSLTEKLRFAVLTFYMERMSVMNWHRPIYVLSIGRRSYVLSNPLESRAWQCDDGTESEMLARCNVLNCSVYDRWHFLYCFSVTSIFVRYQLDRQRHSS